MKQSMDIPPRTAEIGGANSAAHAGKLPHGAYILRCMMLIIERLCLSHSVTGVHAQFRHLSVHVHTRRAQSLQLNGFIRNFT